MTFFFFLLFFLFLLLRGAFKKNRVGRVFSRVFSPKSSSVMLSNMFTIAFKVTQQTERISPHKPTFIGDIKGPKTNSWIPKMVVLKGIFPSNMAIFGIY